MTTPVRIAAFLLGLGVVFAAALGVGRLVDPVSDHGDTEREPAAHGHEDEPADEPDAEAHGTGHDAAPPATEATVALDLDGRTLEPSGRTRVGFTLRDEAGEPVTSYDVEHEKRLHLIVLGTRSLTDYQHVHPREDSPGHWVVDLRLAPGTSYRLYADGSTGGTGFLATADAFTTGHAPAPGPVPAPSDEAQVGGFDVALEQEGGVATLAVTRDGKPVALEPYLGALGHLVVIRVDDLDYLHVHPEEGATPRFAVSGLAPGTYRYFFDFQVGGLVHTAAFTVSTDGSPEGHTDSSAEHEEEGTDDPADDHGH